MRVHFDDLTDLQIDWLVHGLFEACADSYASEWREDRRSKMGANGLYVNRYTVSLDRCQPLIDQYVTSMVKVQSFGYGKSGPANWNVSVLTEDEHGFNVQVHESLSMAVCKACVCMALGSGDVEVPDALV